MGNVILGGLLAIVAGVVGHFAADLLQSRREERARHHERRSIVHLDFACGFNRLRRLVEESTFPWSEETPFDHGYRIDGELRDALLGVQVFASPATYLAACTAMDHFDTWMRADGKSPADSMNAAFEEYLAQARKELGVQRDLAIRK